MFNYNVSFYCFFVVKYIFVHFLRQAFRTFDVKKLRFSLLGARQDL
jgi:hypothetical protein